jgi:hypothetical protein
LYISTIHTIVRGALVIEKEVAQGAGAAAKHRYPIYFISEVLGGSKKYDSEIEKICYVVVMCSRKLRHYFDAHTIRGLTNQPMHDIFGNRDNNRCINFERCSAIKYISWQILWPNGWSISLK